MQIKQITLRHMRMRLLNPFTTSFGTMKEKDFILVEMTDRDGITGWGESVAFWEPHYNEETLKTNWHMLDHFLIPLLKRLPVDNPREIQDKFRHIRGNNMAKSALEGAVWDLYAKKRGISLAKAVGGEKAEIGVGISIGIKKSVEELLDTIENSVAIGYKRIKIKIKPGWDVGVIRRVRNKFPSIDLVADANSAYTLSDLPLLKQLDEFNLMMIEQPLAYNDIIDHSVLQQQLKTPICLDESIHSVEDARKAIELGSCRIINIKIGRVGGITQAIDIHDLCRSRQIPVWCGGMLESGIGRAHNVAISSLPNFCLPGDTAASANYWDEDIIDPAVTVNNGFIQIPGGAGIGYIPNLKKIKERTVHAEVYPLT